MGVCPSSKLQQSHPVITKACLRAPVEIEMSQAHLFSKAMKSWSGHGPKCDFSDSKWQSLAPCPVHGEGGGTLVKGGLYQVSKRGYQAPGLEGCSGSLEHFLTGAAFWYWQRPGLHGDKEIGKENDSSWLKAQKTHTNAFMQTKIRLWEIECRERQPQMALLFNPSTQKPNLLRSNVSKRKPSH